MAYTYKKRTANRKNYGDKRSTSVIDWIVWHYTGNDGDTDENNGNYFANNIVKASAHYFVDDDSVTQSVPDNYTAWSVGGSKYSDCSKTGGGKYYGIVKNTNSISIELCDDVKNGTVYPSAATIENALILTGQLMKKYGIPASHVIRHFDVTGKRCPAYWCGSVAKDKLWAEIKGMLGGVSVKTNPDDEKLTADGLWGKDTTTRLQEIFGTPKDGVVSNQWASYKAKNPGLSSGWDWDTKPNGKGSTLIKAMQKWAGMAAKDRDGEIGPKTIKALQKKLGTPQDGVVSKPSTMVKALQRWANNQK